MRKTLFIIGTMSSFVSLQPVFAIDYLACREMLRTKNEMLDNSTRAEFSKTYPSIPSDICPDFQFTTAKNLGYGAIFNSIDYNAQRECKENWRQQYKAGLKPKYTIGDKFFYYTEQGYRWFLSALKVANDMKKANCPYE